MGLISIDLRLRAAVGFDEVAGVWVSWCPALDIHSQGRDRDEATKALAGALLMYVKHCYRRKILDDLLAERGFHDADPAEVGGRDEVIDIREELDKRHTYDVTVSLPLAKPRNRPLTVPACV